MLIHTHTTAPQICQYAAFVFTAGEDYTVANPLVVPLEICTNRTLFEIPTIYEVELVERTNEYFNVQVLEFDTGLETVTTSVTVVIVEPTGGREY